MMLEQLLTQLSQELEFPAVPTKDDQQMFHVPINPSMNISMKELDPGIFLYSPIGPCPPQKREELFILLMKANFLGQGTGGGTIGMDPEEKFLTLSLALPYDMNYKAFKGIVEDFANFVDYWREELIRHQQAAVTSVY